MRNDRDASTHLNAVRIVLTGAKLVIWSSSLYCGESEAPPKTKGGRPEAPSVLCKKRDS